MFDGIDYNKAILDFITHNLDRFSSTGKELLNDAADSVRLRIGDTYNTYLTTVWKRYSGVKSFFNRNESLDFYALYEPISLLGKDRQGHDSYLRDPIASKIAARNPFTVISGSGGTGKTIMMRHLLLSTILTKEKVPVFVELRELAHSELTLIQHLKEVLRFNGLSLGGEYIEKALKAGHFLILLDGFDEIPSHRRFEVSKQILGLAQNTERPGSSLALDRM